MKLIGDYWGWFGGRSYHHTGVVSTFYAMREALAIVQVRAIASGWAAGRQKSARARKRDKSILTV